MRPAQTQVRINGELPPGEVPENIVPRENTSPQFPPVPASPMQGIETSGTGDNLPG
jgi:hypothetical protein